MPDTYTSQFSGEEIDAALRAAQLFSGADTPAALREKLEIYGSNTALSPTDPTTVETALKYRTNPNLLDNWYFANPVDQRKGYIVPAGVEYYKVDGFVPQGPIPETVRVDYIDYAGSARFNYGGAACYVPKDGGYVRGYMAVGYTVDRWMIGAGSNGTLSLTESGLKLTRTDGIMYLAHRISKTQIPEGTTLTYSALTTLGLYSISFVVKNDTYHEQDVGGGISLGWNYTPAEMMELTLVNNTQNSDVIPIAAKLELGSTQTLAHKENGVWVLNEIPDFGEQLRRCMYYAEKIEDGNTPVITNATFIPAGATSATFVLPYERKRTYPSIRFNDVSNYRVIVRSMSGNTSAFGISNISILDVGTTKAAVLVTFSSATSQDWYGFLQRADNTSGGYAFISADL